MARLSTPGNKVAENGNKVAVSGNFVAVPANLLPGVDRPLVRPPRWLSGRKVG